MLNFNGELLEGSVKFLDATNRGLQFGDAVFEELRVVNGSVYFLEDHYLRLMSSMRILRMEIPMEFTMEFMEAEILKTVKVQSSMEANSIKFTIFRNSGGGYTPTTNTISFLITAENLDSTFFTIEDADYEVELFKDFYKSAGMLSNLNTNNRILNVVGSIYAHENDYHDCLLLNESKMVVEALNGNIFLVKDSTIKTPPLTDGCLNGILRQKLINIILKLEGYNFLEESISPFELQKADELFILNSINGIVPITKYRKKSFSKATSKSLIGKLNAAARITLSKTS
ncbi:aminotransferase class IV [Maribacter sp. X9]|uniref:aminotransferase class IV n=1 Tax=Maribacter sp. X9 TaxID=3402159 RepID=UPI003AF3D53A